MKSSLLPNIHLFETKPGKDNEGMFVCITESGRKLLKELKRDKKNNINEKGWIHEKILANNQDVIDKVKDHIPQTIYDLFELFSRKKKEYTIKQDIIIEQIPLSKRDLVESSQISRGDILTIGKKKFFIKTVKKSEQYNTYQESLGLLYFNNILKKYIQQHNSSKSHIKLNILQPLYSTFNKSNKDSVAIYPYLEGYKKLSTEWFEDRHYSPDNTILKSNENREILDVIGNVREEFNIKTKDDKFVIGDIFEHKNILFKKEGDMVNIYFIDPFIVPWIHTYKNNTQTIHELLTRNP